MAVNGDSKLNSSVEVSSPTPFIYETKLVTTNEWIHENITHDIWGRIKRYLISLFPIFSWIYRYNLTWALGGIHDVSHLLWLILVQISSPV
jgi:hypothetical protein